MSANYKFDDLAKIAKANGVDPQKQGKTKMVNKKKSDLYAEIKQKLGRSPTRKDIPSGLTPLIKARADAKAKAKAKASPSPKRSPKAKPKASPKKRSPSPKAKPKASPPSSERLRQIEDMMDNPIELLIMGGENYSRFSSSLRQYLYFNNVGGTSTYQWLIVVSETDALLWESELSQLTFPYITDDEFKKKIDQFPQVKQLAIMPNIGTAELPSIFFQKLGRSSTMWTRHTLSNANLPDEWNIKNTQSFTKGSQRINKYDIVRTAASPPPKSPNKPIPKLGQYKVVNLVGLKVGKKNDTSFGEDEERIGITVDEFEKLLDDPKFIKKFTKSAKALMGAKARDYRDKLKDLKAEHRRLETKAQRLRQKGVDQRTIEKSIPLEDYSLFVVEMEDIIELVDEKYDSIDDASIQSNLRNAITDKKKGLASILGRVDVKNQLVTQLFAFSKSWKAFYQSFNNMALMGPAGTGKTALAKVIGYMFSMSGILATDKVTITSRVDLVGQYVGQTAPKTRGILMQTMEGVLLIDEAYQLTPCPEIKTNDFGPEAITEIVNFLDKYIGMSIVIVAGYEGVMMRCFFENNEGLPRRFPFRYILGDYSTSDLTNILIHFIHSKSDVRIDQETANLLFSLITQIQLDAPDAFKNQAGDMLNLGTALVKAINSSFRVIWKEGDIDNNMPLIMAGFNDFLQTKGLKIGK